MLIDFWNLTTFKIDPDSMTNLFKLMKTVTNNDTLMLFMEDDDPNHLGIRIENGSKNSTTTYRLNLMDLNEETLQIPPAVFPAVITMRASEFQKVCRDMNAISDTLNIQSTNGRLVLSCVGDFAEQTTILGESNENGMSFIQNKDADKESGGDNVKGQFSLKHLMLFTRCTSLCSSLSLFLKNNYPLIICYQVGSLGDIKLCLAPKNVK